MMSTEHVRPVRQDSQQHFGGLAYLFAPWLPATSIFFTAHSTNFLAPTVLSASVWSDAVYWTFCMLDTAVQRSSITLAIPRGQVTSRTLPHCAADSERQRASTLEPGSRSN
jgi:hypothetical protein